MGVSDLYTYRTFFLPMGILVVPTLEALMALMMAGAWPRARPIPQAKTIQAERYLSRKESFFSSSSSALGARVASGTAAAVDMAPVCVGKCGVYEWVGGLVVGE